MTVETMAAGMGEGWVEGGGRVVVEEGGLSGLRRVYSV
jgi:hypothetical protein